MKLLMENWKKYLNEEQEKVEEGALSRAALGLALGAGAATPAQAADTNTTQGTATTQQADVKVITNTLQPALDEDGNESMRWSFRGALAVAWEGPPLDARNPEIALEKIEIAYEGLECKRT